MILNLFDPTDRIFLTVAIIVVITNFIYIIMLRFDKPIVLGGIVAGFIIARLPIPQAYFDIKTCSYLGDLGIILFMMLLGNSISFNKIFTQKKYALVSLSNIAIPFALGMMLTPYLERYNDNIAPTLFLSLYLGLAISMAAFSLISIFIVSAKLQDSRIGQLALLCASFDEAVFWVLLGLFLIYVQKNGIIGVYQSVGMAIYIALILAAKSTVRKLVNRIKMPQTMLFLIFLGCVLSAILADIVDLHPIFGAFLFGLILPKNNHLIDRIRADISNFIFVILLPVYFAKTGMQGSLHIANDASIIIAGIVVAVVALSGKFAAAYLTGNVMGYSSTESALLGSLLSFRGLSEVVLLNIGYQELNVISTKVYTILLIMTLINTSLSTNITLWLKKRVKR